MSSMYETIMELPLFKGVSHDKISELIETTKFHFLKYGNGETIIESGETCTHLRFLVSGSIVRRTASINRKVVVSEIIDAPNVIGPERLFGIDTTYPFTVTAHGECGILQIDKADYINILQNDKLFIFNILNLLSRNHQKNIQAVLSLSSGSVAERLAFIVLSVTQRGSRELKVEFRQKDMCAMLGVQRTSLMNSLNTLAKQGVITFTTSEISVIDRELLLQVFQSSEN